MWVLGVIFVIVSLWAYAANPVLGLFSISGLQALAYLVTGIIMLLIGWLWPRQSALAAKIFGIIYAVAAVWGFVIGSGDILGIVDATLMNNILHAVLALVLLWAGFLSKKEAPPMSMPVNAPTQPSGTM